MRSSQLKPRRAAFAAWQERIAPVFDVARHLLLVDVAAGAIVTQARAEFTDASPAVRALRLSEWGVDDLVCGAISRPLAVMVSGQGIRLIPFVTGPLDEVVQAWLRGGLAGERFTMPGCCGRPRGRGRRRAENSAEESMMNMKGRGGGGGGAGGGGGGGGRGAGGGGRRGRLNGPLAGGPGGTCVCPQCGHAEPHAQGEPCARKQCPQCGVALRRK